MLQVVKENVTVTASVLLNREKHNANRLVLLSEIEMHTSLLVPVYSGVFVWLCACVYMGPLGKGHISWS